MKKTLTILLLISAVSFGLLFSLSLASAHMEHEVAKADCPMEMPGCLDIASAQNMAEHHIFILKLFGQSGGFFNLLLAIAIFVFAFTIKIIQNKAPGAIISRLLLNKQKIFKKLFKWLSIVQFSYPATISGAKRNI